MLFFPSTPQNNPLQINKLGRKAPESVCSLSGTFTQSFLTASGIVGAPSLSLRSSLGAGNTGGYTRLSDQLSHIKPDAASCAALTRTGYAARPRWTEVPPAVALTTTWPSSLVKYSHTSFRAVTAQALKHTTPISTVHSAVKPLTVAAELRAAAAAARTCGSSWPPCCRVGRTRSCCRFLQRLVCTVPR